MHVLLGNIRVMPHHVFLEPPCRGVIVGLAHVNPYDAFERLQHRAGTNTLERIGPLRSLSQIHCIVISVGESESQCQSFGRLDSQRIDQLLAKQAHRRGAENHDALFVQPNDALIRPKIEQFSQMQVLLFRRRVATGLRFHDTSILRRSRTTQFVSTGPELWAYRMAAPKSQAIASSSPRIASAKGSPINRTTNGTVKLVAAAPANETSA